MRARRYAKLAWTSWTLSAAASVAFVAMEVARHPAVAPGTSLAVWFNAEGPMAALAFASVGAVIASRRPDNTIGWLFLGIGASFGLSSIGGALTDTSAFRSTAWQWGTWLQTWSWVFGWVAMVTYLLLLFPDGHPPSARWRPAVWLAGAAIVLMIVMGMFDPTAGGTAGYRSPFVATLPLWFINFFQLWATVLGFSMIVVCAVAVVKRYRRSTGDGRLQMKVFVYAAIATVLLTPARTVLDRHSAILLVLGFLSIPILPVAVGIAILRYRLYEIDVVINKTVVYASLAAFITAVYVAIVVGIGTAIGQGSQPNLALSILATAVVALAFQPVRQRVQKLANRLVYGTRATPYEVLSEFSSRVATAAEAEEQLPRMARTLAEGTGATNAVVSLGAEGNLRPAAWWPDDTAAQDLSGEAATLSLPVLHHGEQLGAIALTKPAGERLTPAEERLARDLASQAGLVLHNLRLTDELRARVEELRSSRRRLVAAQDAARRRLERNIHDGAQQQLVALSVKTNLARQLATREVGKAASLIDGLRTEARRAMQDLDELASGLVPTALTELGLVEALRAQAARAAVPASVDAADDLRAPADVATAIYFCVLEALQNVAKYANASHAVVRLARREHEVEFEVADDGGGFDAGSTSYGTGLKGMADRLAAMGGTLDVRSARGMGTTITGRVPVAAVAKDRTLEHV
jgi:signal transduction histidine kinase